MFKNWFPENYKFDWADITAPLYVICVVGIILGYDMSALFLMCSGIGLGTSLVAKRLNLVIINLAFIALNLYYLIG